jgi:membrane-bound inhibitor of C-type lysozyme
MLNRRLVRPLAIGAAVVVIAGGAIGTVSATSGNGSAGASTGQTAQAAPAAQAGFAAKGDSNARSTAAAGGAVGTVSSVSTSSFTMSTAGGEKVTVKKASSTTYKKGTSSASASAVTKGAPVLVLGTVNGTTITATQVVVKPPSSGSGTTYTPSKIVAFKRGAPSTAKQDGTIPANYTEGSGTIVKGTTATKATEAALAAYPGGVVDRVVKLSNGEYEVHNIGVNWPHHIFVSKSSKVVGAN